MEAHWDGGPRDLGSDHPSSVQDVETYHEDGRQIDKMTNKMDSKASVSRRVETCINVNKLEGEEDEQQSEAWKRKRRRNVRAPDTVDYMKSCQLTRVLHPLEENPIAATIKGIVNLILVLLLSIPSTLLLALLTPFLSVIKKFRYLSYSCFSCKNERLSGHDAHFLLHKSQSIAHSILIVDGSLDLKRIRNTLAIRTRQGDFTYPRLAQLVVQLPSGPFWLNDPNFNINNHVISGPENISTEKALQKYVAELLYQPLNTSRPLWEVIVLNSYARGRDTVLVCRIHQCIADGMSLLRLLCQSLSDNQVMYIPQKPHFGGITYGTNLARTLLVGPLTVFTWLFWWKPARNLLVFRKPSTYIIPANASKVKSTKKCCGCNGVSGQNSITSGSSGETNDLRLGSMSGAYTVLNLTDNPGYFVTWAAKIPMSKVLRVKQVTRTCLNEVLLTLLTGALRITLKRMGVINTPDLKVNVNVDLRSSAMPLRTAKLSNKASLVPLTLPLEIEGAIPRIWRMRQIMEDMKASADAVVSYCFVWWACKCLPDTWASALLDRLNARGSLQFSSLPGPSVALLFGGFTVKNIFNISPPQDPLNLSVTALTYSDRVHLTVVVKRSMPNAKWFAKSVLVEMEKQCDQMYDTLSLRRLPGEQKRSLFASSEIHSARPLTELQSRLAKVQAELQAVTEQYESEFRRGIHSKSRSDLSKYLKKSPSQDSEGGNKSDTRIPGDGEALVISRRASGSSLVSSTSAGNTRQELAAKVQNLKQEFTDLLMEIRRRKSVHDGGIYIGIPPQIEEEDGEMRKPRNRALSVVSVKSITSLASRDLNFGSRDHISNPKEVPDHSSSSSSISSCTVRPFTQQIDGHKSPESSINI